jgi:hypothetical protein
VTEIECLQDERDRALFELRRMGQWHAEEAAAAITARQASKTLAFFIDSLEPQITSRTVNWHGTPRIVREVVQEILARKG